MSVSNFLMMNVFTALLPPSNAVDYEYYACLGLTKSASLEEIRKAYKKKSLELHPDKVAQRGQQNAQEAAAEYERVQEAASVLQDVKLRKAYHQVGCSVARFRFVQSGGIYNPSQIMENLQHANFIDKTRLVVLVSIFICLVLLQPLLICGKVNAIVERDESSALYDTDWVILLIPFWCLYGLLLVFFGAMALMIKEAAGQLSVTFCEHICWFVGCFLIAQQWDRSRTANWHAVAVPFYLAIILHIYGTARAVSSLRSDQRRMVSLDHLVATNGPLEDMNEGQRAEISEKYIVVTVDGGVVVATLAAMREAEEEVTAEDLEAIRVQSSNEYAESEHAIKALSGGTSTLLFSGIPFIALVAAKLENQIDANWAVVFIPIFVKVVFEILSSCFVCCSVPVGEEVVVVVDNDSESEQGADDEDASGVKGQAAKSTIPEESKDSATANVPDDGDDNNKVSMTDFAAPEGDMADFSGPIDPPGDTAGQTKAKAPSSEPKEGESKQDDDAAGDDPEVDFDEETFRAWQKMQGEMDAGAMQARAKAQSTVFSSTFQLIIITLIVVKLDDDFKNDDPDDTGYNAYWILFPILFVAGIILFCCSCLIYGIGSPSSEDDADHDIVDDEANDTEAMAAEEGRASAVAGDSKADATTTSTTQAAPANAESAESLNDLD